MLKKKYIKSRKMCKVTFQVPEVELPSEIEVTNVSVVGSFNGWDAEATPMKRTKKGLFKVDVDLEPDETYEYRYVANGKHYFNDWAADGYVPNPHGEDNCVVHATNRE